MKTNILLAMLALALLPVQATAQEHWSCDVHAYRYDMTFYVALMVGEEAVADYSDYEIAAFVDGECRGVMQPMTLHHEGENYNLGYLRVRSNQAEGETIDFKVYCRSTNTEYPLVYTSTFFADTKVGMPSMAIPLYRRIMGDCNGDGFVTITDVMIAVGHILDNGQTQLIFINSDIDESNDISIADITSIVNIILGISE